MSFFCPACAKPTLEIQLTIDLSPDADWDEIALQVVACGTCKFEAAAVYCEERRGALDSEHWEHDGMRLLPSEISHIRSLIESCPDPRSPHCNCPTHTALNCRNDRNQWSYESCGFHPAGGIDLVMAK